MVGIVAVAVFANFAAYDISDSWLQYVAVLGSIVVIIPVLLGSRMPALASTFGIHATLRENPREAWKLNTLPKQWWLYMAGFVVLLMVNGTVAELPAVEKAVRVPHTITGALVAVYIVTVNNLWRRHIRRRAR